MSAAGTLRERVEIGTAATATNGAGDPVRSWFPVAEVYARMDPIKVSEVMRASREAVEARYRCTIRHRDISAINRIVWRGRVFDVDGIVNPDERRRFLSIEVKETEA